MLALVCFVVRTWSCKGTEEVDRQSCHGWTKSEGFIRYWSSVETGRPVRWIFFDGAQFEVMTWEEGLRLEDFAWQAPEYCFGKGIADESSLHEQE